MERLHLSPEPHAASERQSHSNSPQKALPGTPFVDIPLEPSGSPTYPLDMVATRDSKSGRVMLSVANPTEEPQRFTLRFDGGKPDAKVTVNALAPAQSTDENSVDNPDVIRVQMRKEKLNATCTVPPHSITLYEYAIR